MQYVRPQVFHVASTRVHSLALDDYLKEIRAGEWETDAQSDAEMLFEVAGRLCYRSFVPGLNANVTKVREGNNLYLRNIIGSGHGSVLEHAGDTYIFHNVSRVFTHEQVRNRVGLGYSQESLRYVRLDELKTYYPPILADLPPGTWPEGMSRNDAHQWLKIKWESVIGNLEEIQGEMAKFFNLDKLPFDLKKRLTSVMRRLAPIGLATDIMVTANHRAWRHVIQQRTSRHAEEEIRLVYGMVFEEQAKCYPNIYQDGRSELVDGLPEVMFEKEKV